MTAEKRYVKRIGWMMQWRLHISRQWDLMPDRKIYKTRAGAIRCYGSGTYKENRREGIWRLKPVYVEVSDGT